MQIDKDFEGANIRVLSIKDDTVLLENEIRDTVQDWFYWAFHITGTAGRTVQFRFPDQVRIGYWGAAVSHDLKNWKWTGNANQEYTGFTYTFGNDEDDAYFCHDMRYSTAQFTDLCNEMGWTIQTLTTSEKGRPVPMIEMGEGEDTLLLTSRHHACESTGTYVLEGTLRYLKTHPLPGFRVICIPFVDYDGVIDGDQGKARNGHDHNSDYEGDSIYASIRAIKEIERRNHITLAVDLHSPWHFGGRHDVGHSVRRNPDREGVQSHFCQLLTNRCRQHPEAFQYDTKNDLPIGEEWNQPTPVHHRGFSIHFAYSNITNLGIVFETPYFGTADNVVTQAKLLAYGTCMGEALHDKVKELIPTPPVAAVPLTVRIDKNFEGGNIKVHYQENDRIFLSAELRDTTTDWFYWAFRVRGAAGKTLHFDFLSKNRVGPFGPAVSHDLLTWNWGGSPEKENTSFVYTFGPSENEVFFCHSMRYSTAQFFSLCKATDQRIQYLGITARNREIPFIEFGNGEKSLILTSRHHACESTGTYVLEGIIRSLKARPIPGFRVICIPFMDLDGVIDGDQGKNRAPYDHNRDYKEPSIYTSTRYVRKLADNDDNLIFALDLHSPWHFGGRNDVGHGVRTNERMDGVQALFGEFLTKRCQMNKKAFQYDTKNDLHINEEWNVPSNGQGASFTAFFGSRKATRFSLSLETPYFGLPDNKVSQENLIEYGTCVADALRDMAAARG